MVLGGFWTARLMGRCFEIVADKVGVERGDDGI